MLSINCVSYTNESILSIKVFNDVVEEAEPNRRNLHSWFCSNQFLVCAFNF
jgi:hypothetical protein